MDLIRYYKFFKKIFCVNYKMLLVQMLLVRMFLEMDKRAPDRSIGEKASDKINLQPKRKKNEGGNMAANFLQGSSE